jgi:homoserine O-acetyltransferase/O-succinyltransferase
MRFLALAAISTVALAQSHQQSASLGDFRLASGKTIPNCRIGYRTFGALNADRSNAVLFPTWFTGRTEDLEGQIGPGKLVDSSRLYVIAVDALGDGVSSSPSTGPMPFPEITIRDMIESQHLLLTRNLAIPHLRAVVGISMGGMQTFEWMTAHPEFFDRAVPIVGSPRLTTTDLLLWQAELSAIEAARKCRCDPHTAMEAVAAIHQFALYTPTYRAEKTPPSEFASFKATIGQTHMTPEDWAAQLGAMMGHDAYHGKTPAQAAAGVKAEALVVVAAQDHMVNPIPARQFAAALHARIIDLGGDCGHMAPSCESGRLVPTVSDFLAGPRRGSARNGPAPPVH